MSLFVLHTNSLSKHAAQPVVTDVQWALVLHSVVCALTRSAPQTMRAAPAQNESFGWCPTQLGSTTPASGLRPTSPP
jgi:hypothetical protein